MLILLALLCADPELAAAKADLLAAAKSKADSITDEPAVERIRQEMEAFLKDDRKVPSSPHLLALRDKYVAQRALWRQKYLEALPESERGATEARWEQEDAVPPIPMRTKWMNANGISYAILHGKVWGEYNPKGVLAYRWEEVARTPEYVELHHKRPGFEYSRRMYETHSYIRIGKAWEAGTGRWLE